MTRSWIGLLLLPLFTGGCAIDDPQTSAPSSETELRARPWPRSPRSFIDDRPLLALMPMVSSAAPQSDAQDDAGAVRDDAPISVSMLADRQAAPVPSGLYLSGAVTEIVGPEERELLVAADFAWQRAGCHERKLFRVYSARLETSAGGSRPIAVLIDGSIGVENDLSIASQTFRSYAELPPELRADDSLPVVWEVNRTFPYTIGDVCDPWLARFSRGAVVTGFEPTHYVDSSITGMPAVFGLLWHEAAGHAVADGRPGTTDRSVTGEPFMTLYSHRAVLGSQMREINSDRMARVLSALWADRTLSEPRAAEPSTVDRRLLRCGFPRNLAVMERAFSWLSSYFADVSCEGWEHRVAVIHGHFAAPDAPDSVAVYGRTGERVSCMVNAAGVDGGSGEDMDRVVAQRLPNGLLACSAVCPNGTVQNIYGLGTGDQRACIPIRDCFAQGGFRAWYNSIQDFCEFASSSFPPRERCRSYFDGRAVGVESGNEYRCVSHMLCRQSWAPPDRIGYGGRVEGDRCVR